jgi:Holliday junction resolvase RusA-like endonuclease
MIKIEIKPLSVNDCWQGRRFKTPLYKKYEVLALLLLPKKIIENKPLKIDITFGFSSKASDIDNPLKPFLDILQKKYKINDKNIFQLNVKKEIVNKGFEFIKFNIDYV